MQEDGSGVAGEGGGEVVFVLGEEVIGCEAAVAFGFLESADGTAFWRNAGELGALGGMSEWKMTGVVMLLPMYSTVRPLQLAMRRS